MKIRAVCFFSRSLIFSFFTLVTIFIYAAASHGMPSAMWRQLDKKEKRRRNETEVFERMNGVGKNALNIVRKVKRGTCNARMKMLQAAAPTRIHIASSTMPTAATNTRNKQASNPFGRWFFYVRNRRTLCSVVLLWCVCVFWFGCCASVWAAIKKYSIKLFVH